jgi:serine protease Do
MYSDEENKSGADLNDTAPSSENFDKTPDNPENTRSDEPRQPETEPKANPIPYYEPWQQPVYSQTQEPFAPELRGETYNTYQQNPPSEPQPGKKKKPALSGLAKAVCLILVCAIVSGGATFGVMQVKLNELKNDNRSIAGGNTENQGNTSAVTDSSASPSSSGSGSNGATNLTSTGTEMSAEDIYAMAVNQVVGVNSEEKTNIFGAETPSAVSGSGFIISSDGYIVTNYHVIAYAVEQGFSLTVMMHNGKSFPAKVIGYEQDNDLAVIKIDATGLSTVTMGNNDTMKVGDKIYAVGNPLGELDYTMTNGIVSALDRVIQVEDTTSINMFQIDAAVNAGNSGGPVYNSKGQVIGIVSAKYASTGVEGLGFAIPINDAKDIVNQLMTTGHVSGKPSMGISVKTVTKQEADFYKLAEGAAVASVTSGSCADKAGLKVGDIITKLGDTVVTSADTLKQAKKSFKAGDTTTVVINRSGQELSLKITFDEEGVTSTSSQTSQQPSITQPSFQGSAN